MTRDDIIAMARECGVNTELDTLTCYGGFFEVFEQFAALVAAAEREACAGLCGWKTGVRPVDAAIETCAAAIRARGETK